MTSAQSSTISRREAAKNPAATRRAEAMLARLNAPMRTWQLWALAALWGALTWASFPPLGLWPLTMVAPLPLAWLALRARSAKAAMLAAYVVGVIMWLALSVWLVQVTAAGYPLYGMFLAIYPVLFVWAFRRLAAHHWFRRWPAALTLPVLWIGIEFLRGEILFHGYPWFLIAHPLIEWPPLAQSVDVGGVYGLGLLAAATCGAIIDLLRWWRLALPTVTSVAAVAAVGALHVGNVVYGLWRIGQMEMNTPGPNVLVVQTNLPQSNKNRWEFEEQLRDFERWVRLTLDAGVVLRERGTGIDLVAWPETMVPGFGFDQDMVDYLVRERYEPGERFTGTIERLSELLDAPMLVGSPTYIGGHVVGARWEVDQKFNSSYLVDGEPPHARYDKIFLTPFGETMPYISAWPWLESKLLAVGAAGMEFDLDAGGGPSQLAMEWNGRALRLATPICFEATVARICRQLATADGRMADLFVNLTNDGWFGWYDAGRAQHAQIARFRCIENRAPMLRVANTGLSMLIDSAGRVREVIGSGRYGTPRVEDWVLVRSELDPRTTIYTRIGDLFGRSSLIVAAAFITVALLWSDRGKGIA